MNEPKVNIIKHGGGQTGYTIEVEDELSSQRLAITEEELTQIAIQSQNIVMKILNK